MNKCIINTGNYNDYIQFFSIKKENKEKYGEVHTPYHIIESMVSLFPKDIFTDPNIKILDPGSGHGYYSIFLFHFLNKSLCYHFPNKKDRHEHIIKNMLYMIEYNEEHISLLRDIFGKTSNVYHGDYLRDELPKDFPKTFDIIIGNPPYNSEGFKKVPTNHVANKKKDGKTIWFDFLKRSMQLLKKQGLLSFIIPSIWMKPDKYNIYDYILSYKIDYIHCLNNTQTNTHFKGNAQTPTCYFLLKNEKSNGYNKNIHKEQMIHLFDQCKGTYIDYPLAFGGPIPLFGSSIVKKLLPYVLKYGSLKDYVKKTNMPPKRTILSKSCCQVQKYVNIRTCILKNKVIPEIKMEYSNIPLSFHGVSKLILAHKMYGFPYLDISGTYGISNRDNYVVYNKSVSELKLLQKYLSTNFALYMFESTRYRMKYLEKYVFEFLPDITKMYEKIEDNTSLNIEKLFSFTSEEITTINNHTRKQYTFFI